MEYNRLQFIAKYEENYMKYAISCIISFCTACGCVLTIKTIDEKISTQKGIFITAMVRVYS